MATMYNNKCVICHNPSMGLICSNIKCKSWSKYRCMAVGKKIIESGLTSDNPIIIRCPICNTIAIGMSSYKSKATCQKHNLFDWTFTIGLWYYIETFDKHSGWTYNYIGGQAQWNYKSVIKNTIRV